jgi:hypothetical protein
MVYFGPAFLTALFDGTLLLRLMLPSIARGTESYRLIFLHMAVCLLVISGGIMVALDFSDFKSHMLLGVTGAGFCACALYLGVTELLLGDLS